jgi:flagellar basal body-associated protein FliL
MVYFDDDASSASLKSITMIIAAVTAIAFGCMYFVYSGSQKNSTETQSIDQISPPTQASPTVPAKPPVHTHV